ncbi:hypothetical protein DVH24_018382 [Malus domestica]|uniref:TIR domain-containing protein n=1 Tax=Malus domestica TaxID=3750 RepID=A0A498KDC1_MALDO|nr:hypothetical protein DVH24_018382 [Malus domestica]
MGLGRARQQIVLPVFYKVDPSHVRNQTSSFGDAFTKLEGKFKDNKEKVLMWRRALRAVANLSGHPVNEEKFFIMTGIWMVHHVYEATIMSNTVNEILVRVLDGTYLNVAKHPVGIQSCVQEVKELLVDEGGGGEAKDGRSRKVLAGDWTSGNQHLIDRQLTRGEEISQALLQAIEESRISLVIFSKNYASSRWCLDELIKIRQCKKSKQQIVLPVFYKVDPSHVRNQTSSFGVGFTKLQGKFKDNKKKVLMWRRALREVANLSGHLVKEEGYNLAKFTSMNFRGCKFLEKIPDLSGSPNLKHLVLSECKSLVEVDDSVGFLDKLVYLNLNGCSKLMRFATRLGLRSLEWLYLKGCTRLERFPKIEEGKMESLTDLDIQQSGIRELPSSIAYLTGLQRLKANECENLTGTSLHHIYGLQDLIQVHFSKCPKLVTFGKNTVKFDEVSSCSNQSQLLSTDLDISDGNSITLALPNLFDLDLGGCNLSESDFLVSLGCCFALASLDLSRNNFVSLPDCFSKFVNLMKLRLSGCMRLREIPQVLPPGLCDLYLDDCTSLEKIPKLPPMLEHLELTNCFRLGADEVAKLENNLLNEEPLQRGELQVILPGNEVQKWFRPSNYHAGHLVSFDMSYSGIRQLKGFKNSAKITSMNFRGCEFLEKIPDLSGSPNLKHLVLSECKSLVEVDDSVEFLDKLVYLNLNGCSKLTRFATRLGLRSLEWLYLKGCTRLERFPEIEEGKMESLTDLDIQQSGIRELPSSIAYLTGLQRLKANECVNLTGTSLHHIYGLQDLIQVYFGECPKLVTFGKNKVKFDEVSSCNTQSLLHSTDLDTSDDNSITLALPNLFDLDLGGCNLSESDFLVPLGCWFALASLDLSRNNFVSLPDCISKFVNLMKLRLSGCRRLRKIPQVLPPSLCGLYLDDCTSLEKIPKLPPMLERLELTNCIKLSGDEVAKLKNNWLNEESLQLAELQVILPGNKVQKWPSYTP